MTARDSGWVSTEHSRRLSGRPSSDTRPELMLRTALHGAGFRYRLHVRFAPVCRPDIVLPRHRLAVWVDGCFWHGHEHKVVPKDGPNAKRWQEKIWRNRERDQEAVKTARSLEWVALRFWECEIYEDVDAVVSRVRAASLAGGRAGSTRPGRGGPGRGPRSSR